MNEEDRKVLSMMVRYGGSFVQALAQAGYRADENNLRRIKETWPEYWSQYSAMANQVAAAIIEKHPMAEYQNDE